jgi:subtilisin family serine protease
MQAANVTIIGGLPRLGVLLVAAPSTADFSGLDTSLISLRADPAIGIATRSERLSVEEVPQAAEPTVAAPRPGGLDWTWDLTTLGTGEPFGRGGNWGLKASRFPQAWNLLETIWRKKAQVNTDIIDAGFGSVHADLSALTSEPVCTPVVNKCTTNGTHDHSTHVAGIIGADFNNSLDAGHSLGVSGANPVAHMHGISSSFATAGGSSRSTIGGLLEILNVILAKQEASHSATWRVVNFSMGPLVKDMPSDDVASTGELARAVAELAAKDRVLIVQAAGNDSTSARPIPALRAGFFTWAAANWVSAQPNPIIVVEAIGNDDANNDYPVGWVPQSLNRAGFSNGSGNISAPGVLIASTASTEFDVCVKSHVIATADPYCLMSGTSMAAPFVTGLIGYLLAYNPDLTIAQIRAAVLDSAVNDSVGAAPRLDAFGALLSLPRAAKDLVDVNDYSPDGNHRQKLGPDGADQGPDTQFTKDHATDGRSYLTDPDDKVDMRDFRRFRDAWLLTCTDTAHLVDRQLAECRHRPSSCWMAQRTIRRRT